MAAATTTAAANVTTVTSFSTLDSDSATFAVGILTVTLTLPPSASYSSLSTNGGIITDTSSPPARPTTATSTTSATASATSTASSDVSSGPSPGQMAGIIVGSVAGGCLLMAIIFFFCWRQKRKQLAKQKSSPEGLADNSDSHPDGSTRATFGSIPERPSTDLQAANQRGFWRRSLGLDDTGTSAVPAQRQKSARRFTNSGPRPRSRSYLPISAPIPVNRSSIQDTFNERFFRQPPPASRSNPPSGDDDARHGSDATTIRTSGNPPTPVRPTITLLRLCSSSTTKSKGNSVDEEKESENDEVPPLPLFRAIDIPNNSTNARFNQGGPSRIDLESGIKTNLSKATSRIPLTPRYENNNTSPWVRSQGPPIPRSSLSKSRRNKISEQSSLKIIPPNPPMNESAFKGSKTSFPVLSAQPPPLVDIPERSSSRQGTRTNEEPQSDEEWLVQENLHNIVNFGWELQEDEDLAISPKTVDFPLSDSPTRGISYPTIPPPISEPPFRIQDPKPLSSPKEGVQNASPTNARQIARKPLPPTTYPQPPLQGPSNYLEKARRLQPPGRLSIPPTASARPQSQSTNNHSSSRATLTPNPTPTGDLVLTVDMADMLDYVVYD